MRALTEKQLDVLRWMVCNEGTPVAVGANTSKRGSMSRFSYATLNGLEMRGAVTGRIGNDGARWYELTRIGFDAYIAEGK